MSQYIEFSAPRQIEVRGEDVGRPAPNELVYRSTLSLISPGTELACLRGEFDPGSNWEDWVQYPFRPGYCSVGIVEEVGADVDGVHVGDRVQSYAPHQQHVRLRADEINLVPDTVSDEAASWVPLVVTAAAGVARAAIRMGERVGIIGLGPLGQLVVQYAVAQGASMVLAVDKDPQRLALAHDHGATGTVGVTADAAVDAIRDLTSGAMLDVVFEVTGSASVLAAAVQLTRPLGRIVLLGDTPVASRQPLGPGVVSKSLSILGAHAQFIGDEQNGSMPSRRAVTDLYFRRLDSKVFRTDDLVHGRRSALDAAVVYQRLLDEGPPAGALCFDWSQPGHDLEAPA